jgi:hypothetical protein
MRHDPLLFTKQYFQAPYKPEEMNLRLCNFSQHFRWRHYNIRSGVVLVRDNVLNRRNAIFIRMTFFILPKLALHEESSATVVYDYVRRADLSSFLVHGKGTVRWIVHKSISVRYRFYRCWRGNLIRG